jgi:hypothetical protein
MLRWAGLSLVLGAAVAGTWRATGCAPHAAPLHATAGAATHCGPWAAQFSTRVRGCQHLRGGHDSAPEGEGPHPYSHQPALRAMLEEAAAEVNYDLEPLPEHYGTPKTAQEAASVGAPDAVPPPAASGSNVCDEDWPIDPISGERRFGEWFYQEPAGVADPGPPVLIPNAQDAHLLDPRDFEDVELSTDALNERLLYAALTGQDTWIEKLVAMGAQVNRARDVAFGNATALHCCAVSDSSAVARELISLGADVRLLNAFRQSPLHLAAHHGNTEVLKVMYRRGAQHPPSTSGAAGAGGATAAATGKRRGSGAKVAHHDQARRLLLLKDAYGYSALEYAESENRSAVANFIRQELAMAPIDATTLASQKQAELAAAARIKALSADLELALEMEKNASRTSEGGFNNSSVSSPSRAGSPTGDEPPSEMLDGDDEGDERTRVEEMMQVLRTVNMTHPHECIADVVDLCIRSTVGKAVADRLWYGDSNSRRGAAATSMEGWEGSPATENASMRLEDMFRADEGGDPADAEVERDILRWAEEAIQAGGRGGVKAWADQFSEDMTFNLNLVPKSAIKECAPDNPYNAADYLEKGIQEIEDEAAYFEKHGKLPPPKVRSAKDPRPKIFDCAMAKACLYADISIALAGARWLRTRHLRQSCSHVVSVVRRDDAPCKNNKVIIHAQAYSELVLERPRIVFGN